MDDVFRLELVTVSGLHFKRFYTKRKETDSATIREHCPENPFHLIDREF